jgi:hypothetical protein
VKIRYVFDKNASGSYPQTNHLWRHHGILNVVLANRHDRQYLFPAGDSAELAIQTTEASASGVVIIETP